MRATKASLRMPPQWRGPREDGATLLEYILALAILLPVATGIGILLQSSAQKRGEAGVLSTQYGIPCHSGDTLLNSAAGECR